MDKKPVLPGSSKDKPARTRSRFMECAYRLRQKSAKQKKFEDMLAKVLIKAIALLALVAYYALCLFLLIGFWYLVWNKLVCRAFPALPHATYLQVVAVCFVLGFVGSYFRSRSNSGGS